MVEKPKLKKKKVNQPPIASAIEVEPDVFNIYLMKDQALMSEVLFKAVLYINSLENELGIKHHKEVRVANPKHGTSAWHYYQAFIKLQLFESSYIPYDATKANRSCYRPWRPKTLIEDLTEREKWMLSLNSLAKDMLENPNLNEQLCQ